MSTLTRLHSDEDYAAPVALVETTTVTLAGDWENLVERTVVAYDDEGRIAEVSQNGPPATYRYERLGPARERVMLVVNGTVVREFQRITQDGSVFEETEYPRGAPDLSFPFEGLLFRIPGAQRSVFRYDDGRFHSAEFHAAGEAIGTIATERDAHGRLTRVVQTMYGHTVASLRRTYDDARREITLSTDGDGVPETTRRVIVDDDGRMIAEELIFFGTGRRTEYRYQLNDRGDWVERTAFNDGMPVARTRREITYR